MALNTRNYSDVDPNFFAHPVTGDVSRKFNQDAIKQSIKNLILTNHYERPFHSEIGTSINALLFEPSSPMLSAVLKQEITNVINTFEPRVILNDVEVIIRADSNDVFISITFTIINTNIPLNLDIILERKR